jgi:hypothetical protein
MAGENISASGGGSEGVDTPSVGVETAPAVAPPVEAVAESPAQTETILEGQAAEAAPPVVDADSPTTEKSADTKPEAKIEAEVEAPTPLSFDAFKLPEGFVAEKEIGDSFVGLLGDLKLNAEQGQKLLDLHASTFKAYQDRVAQKQQDEFEATKAAWAEDFYKTAGNRRDTIANDAKWAISQLVPDAGGRKELFNVLAFTGAGNHPALINLMAAAAKKMRERGPAPTPVQSNKASAGSPWDNRYGGSGT